MEGMDMEGIRVAHMPRKAVVMQNIPLCSRQHSPLHEAPKPGQAADEPPRGVNLQEVTGETLDDGLHVGGAALHELHHLQHTRDAQGWRS